MWSLYGFFLQVSTHIYIGMCQEATPLGCVRAVGWGLFGNSQNSYQMIEANQKHVQI